MKILLVNATLSGGAAIACKRLKNSFKTKSAEVQIFTLQSLAFAKTNFLAKILLKCQVYAAFLFETDS